MTDNQSKPDRTASQYNANEVTIMLISDQEKEALAEFRRASDPVAAFVAERCEAGEKLTVSKRDLFAAFQAFCRQENHQDELNQATFGKRLRALVPGICEERPRSGATRERVWKGIAVQGAVQEWSR